MEPNYRNRTKSVLRLIGLSIMAIVVVKFAITLLVGFKFDAGLVGIHAIAFGVGFALYEQDWNHTR